MTPVTLPDPPAFLACTEIGEVRVPLAAPTKVAVVQAWFLGCAESETWNSWLRSPRLPPPGSLSVWGNGELLTSREARYCAAALPGAPAGDATLIELTFAERPLFDVVLRFPPGRWALFRVQAAASPLAGSPWPGTSPAEQPFPRPQPDLPKRGDALADALAPLAASAGRLGGEPTLDDVFQLALPYRGGALLGIPEGPLAYQLWNGSLVLRPGEHLLPPEAGDRVLLQLFAGEQPLLPSSHGQRLGDGYLPVGEAELDAEGLALAETAFVDATGTLRLELRLKNRRPEPVTLSLRAVASRRLTAHNDRTLHAEVHTPLGCHVDGETLRLSAEPLAPPPRFPLSAGESAELTLRLPLGPPGPKAPAAEEFLAQGSQLELPDSHLQNLWRALLLHTRLFVRGGVMRYGLFPGLYEDGLFGIEEGWNIVSLAQYGHAAAAAATLERTFFDAEFLKKEGPHHQYRNGLAITYALDVYSLTADRGLLARLWNTVRESADWIAGAFAGTRTLEEGARPPHYGLMPRHIYGGDLRTPAYSLYASSACWRGLRDAGRIAELVGESAAAADLLGKAAEARRNILAAAKRIYRADAKPPFLPFRTDETADTPSSGDYYQLFASLILETAVFGWHGRFAHAISDYLDASGREVLGVPRFDVWFGRLGVDAEYARGRQLLALMRRDFARFYIGLLGQLGLSCDPYTFVSPETAVVRFSPGEARDRLLSIGTQACRADSDPCSAGTGVMLQYLRYMLVAEERDEDDLPTGALWLSAAAPAAWYKPGQSFAVTQLPTLFGPISFRCSTEERWVVYEIAIASAAPVLAELFYRDSEGRRRSARIRLDGAARLALPRT